jgi:hypothetical protein
MRLDNLLSLRRSAFVTTIDSNHELEVHLNLANRIQLSAVNQLWLTSPCSYSKRVRACGRGARCFFQEGGEMGALDRSLAASLAIDALQEPFQAGPPSPALSITRIAESNMRWSMAGGSVAGRASVHPFRPAAAFG